MHQQLKNGKNFLNPVKHTETKFNEVHNQFESEEKEERHIRMSKKKKNLLARFACFSLYNGFKPKFSNINIEL